MTRRARTVGVALAGAASWTVLEYVLHRFAMHRPRGRGLASREHLAHHADVDYFSPARKKLLSASVTTVLVYPGAVALVGRARATAYTGGLVAAYFGYEVAHRRTHTHPPRGAYGRWARRNHLHHHFGAPTRNLGVTTAVWDRLFGTYVAPGVVAVPRRFAPVWLLDESGEVRPQFAADFRVVGRRRTGGTEAERDRALAFANVPPPP